MKVHTHEPYVSLETESNFFHWTKADEIAFNQNLRQREKHRAYQFIFDMLVENGVSGDYLEFGCHRGRTFRMALTEARRHSIEDMRFFAFDSFDGLPNHGSEAADHRRWKRGARCTSLSDFNCLINSHGIYCDRVTAVKGFYSETLIPELKADFLERGVRAAFITVDCDLYESAVDVFNFVDHFLTDGTVLYIDDFFAGYRGNSMRGVGKAFKEFSQRLGQDWEFVQHMTVGWWGRTFVASRHA